MTPREARRQLGAAAVLSEAEAVALLPVRDSTARKWLRAQGLVSDTALGRLVLWERVIDALFRDPPQERAPSKRTGALPRAGVYTRR